MADLKIARGFALPLDMVTEATAIVATRGAGKSSTGAVFVEETFPAHVPVVVLDWTGVFWGLRSNATGNGPGLGIYVLGGPHGDVPLEPHAGALIADLVVDSGHSFVLDLSDFTKGQMRHFAADFLERLYERKARARTTLLLLIDEAHEYAPQNPRGGFKGDAARLIAAMEQVVALGRSRGIGAVLITQRTQALNKAVLDLVETLIVMRMLSPRAVAAVKDWIAVKNEDDERGVLASLPELPTGTAWVWSPLRGILERISVRRIKTFDSYATPKPGEVRVEPQARKELDLAALGERMRATVERAKENDPDELRNRARQAESMVETYRSTEARLREQIEALEERPVEPVEVRIEVPVLTDDERAKVAHIAKAIDGLGEQMQIVVEVARELTAAITARETRPAVPPRVGITTRRAPERETRSQRDVPPVTRSGPEAAPDTSAPGGASNGKVDNSEQRVLDSFVWYEALGIEQPTKQQVALVAGYRAIGGRFGNLLGGLRTKGLVAYPSPGIATLTAEGRALARSAGLPHDNVAVQAQVMQRLDPSQQKVLAAVIARYPHPVEKEFVAQECGYTAIGGRFGNLLGSLRTLGLIEYPQPRLVVARDVLFPLG